jgi:hypothetical protein
MSDNDSGTYSIVGPLFGSTSKQGARLFVNTQWENLDVKPAFCLASLDLLIA